MNHRQIRIVLSVLLLLGLLASLPFRAPYAQSGGKRLAAQFQRHNHAQSAGLTAEATGSDGYVIVQGEHGSECRAMTAQEEQALSIAERNVPLEALSSERTDPLQQQQGLTITLRATSQLDNFPQAREAFLRAAAKWQSIIQSPITVVIDVDFGPTLFGTPYPSGVIGATSPQILLAPNVYPAIRQALLSNAANQQQTAIFNSLPGASLPTELGNTTNISSASANLRALGAIDPVANPSQEPPGFGPPPAIGFNSAFAFDFDPSNGIDPDKLDFEGTAIHELGHALGFTTAMGNKELSVGAALSPTPWDLFRFRPGGLGTASLTDKQRAQVSGGDQVFFAGGEEYALSTGTVAGTGGDLRQGSHWKDDSFTGQFLGIMDPSGSNGERDEISPADLTALSFFGYRINPAAKVYELLAVSDNTREETQTRTNALVVNRYTPSRYPAKLESFRVLLPAPLDGSPITGEPLRIIAFADQNRTGQPPANPTLLVDQALTISALPSNRVLDVLINNGPTIERGDLYVGVQTSSSVVALAADLNGRQQNRSFISTNNGQSFQGLTTTNAPTPAPVNFIARAFMSMTFGNTPAPGAITISPAAVAPGSPAFTLTVFGSNFQSNSVVRLNGGPRTTTFLSGSVLQAQIPPTDVTAAGTAKVTVFTPEPNGGETVAVDLALTANNPLPTLTRLDPPGGAAGASNLTLNVFGTSFNAQSRIRVNGNERQTTLINSTQLSTTLTQADLSSTASLNITVANPAPGGGASNSLTFSVVTCTFSTSISGNLQNVSSTLPPGVTAAGSGFVLSASNNVCPWTATSSEPWVTLTTLSSGVGRSVINYLIQPQPPTGTAPREARLSVGNQTVTVRQLGRAVAGSAASFNFTAPLAPESIAAIFGEGIARETRAAEGTLPTTLGGAQVLVQDSRGAGRPAPLFFVSPRQNNFQVPLGTATGNGFVLVVIDGQLYADSRVMIASTSPGLFAANSNGQGVPAAVLLRVKPDNTQTFETVAEINPSTNRFVPKPIDFGPETDRLFLVLFGTGIRGRASLSSVSFQIGGTNLPVQSAGAQGSLVGLDQVNLELPRSLAGRGEVDLVGRVDGRDTNTLRVAFK